MKEPWTVERFIELLKRHDAGVKFPILLANYETCPQSALVEGRLNLESLVEELNEWEGQS